MTPNDRLHHGTVAWFEMVGRLMCDVTLQAALRSNHNVLLVERYTDGKILPNGLTRRLRFEITSGLPSFRVQAQPRSLLQYRAVLIRY